jgi:hypothetical protein
MQIPQSTSRVVMLKLFETGTTTAATGKTLAITISKDGGAFANPNAGATNATEVSAGWYKVTLDTTDTNTLGDLVVRGTAATCDDSERILGVVSATTGGLTNLDAAVSTRMATYTQPTGFLAATFPATVASTTNITGGTITTVTNLTNAPTVGDFTAAMKASINTEADTALADYDGPTNAEMVARTLAAADYATAADQTAIKAKTDSLTFTVAGKMDSNVLYVAGVQIDGTGTAADPWGPV